MISSIGLTISGLVFTLLIAIIYFTKKKYTDVENKTYGFLLILTIFLLLIELYCVYTMKTRNNHPFLNELMCRVYLFGAIIWMLMAVIYTIILTKKEKYDSFLDAFKDPITNIIVITGFLSFGISCFLPLTYTSGRNNELYVIGGKGVLPLYIVSGLVGLYLIYVLFQNKNKETFFKRLPILALLGSYFVMLVFQYFYTDINELTFMFSLAVVAMYFSIVSQDFKLVTDLEFAKQSAEKADKDKSDFLSKMSHEIRTPMNVIMGYSESLLSEKNIDENKIKNDAKTIYIAGNNLISTINNILDVSNIESGKEKLEESKYFIGDIVSELQNYATTRINQDKVSFNIEFDENIPRVLYGDKRKIYKILFNILSNSINYTTNGQITFKISAVCEKGYAHLKFTIEDTGIGIKEEDFDKVFIKFAKLNSDTQGLERGAGLGLNIAKSLLDIMGGKISFNSQYSVGTTFVVELNNKIIDYHKSGSINNYKSLSNDSKGIDCTGKKVMIVDDNKLNLKVADRLFQSYNFDVTLVQGGTSCLKLIKQNKKFDLILLDHLMPDLNGIETIRELKKLNDIELPPLIITTANMDASSKELFVKEGFSGYLLKPLDSTKIKGIVNYYFKK